MWQQRHWFPRRPKYGAEGTSYVRLANVLDQGSCLMTVALIGAASMSITGS
jgi:hypothetical protein